MTENKYRYYSQNGEDFLLWNFFNHKEMGFYVDVGAFDGVHLSNTFSFEQQGWAGMCIEPHPDYFPLCQQARPNSVCLNVACVDSPDIEYVAFYSENSGLFSGIIGDREDEIAHNYKHGFGLEFSGMKRISVPASTLNSLLNEHLPPDTEIDFISIDVEGSEIDVLQGLDISRFAPSLFLIETNTEAARQKISNHLSQFGYIEARQLRINSFYVRDMKDATALQSIEVGYKSEKNIHPLGERYTLKPFKNEGFRSERQMHIEQQHNELKEKLNLKNRQLAEKDRQLAEKDRQLTQKEQQLAQKDQQLARKDQKISQKDLQLEKNKQKIDQLNTQIQNLFNSHSYRIGRILLFPFPIIKRFLKRLIQ